MTHAPARDAPTRRDLPELRLKPRRGPAPDGRAPLDLQQRSRHRAHAAHGLRDRARCAACVGDRDRFLGYAYVNPHALICARILGRDAALSARQVAARASPAGGAGAARAAVRGAVLPARLRRIRRAARPRARPLRRRGRRPDRHGRHGGAARPTIVEAVEQGDRPARVALEERLGRARARRAAVATSRRRSATRPRACVEVEENGVRFRVPLGGGPEDRLVLRPGGQPARVPASTCAGRRVLDVFSYLGALGPRGGAGRAPARSLCVDSSAPALELLQASAAANGLDGPHAARRRLRRAGGAARRPARSSTWSWSIRRRSSSARKDMPKGQAAYRKLNQLAMQLLPRDGILVSCSCSYHLAHGRPDRRHPAGGAPPRTASRR